MKRSGRTGGGGIKACSVEGCGRKHKARGLCMRHYQRQWVRVAPGAAERRARTEDWKRTHPARCQKHQRDYRRRNRSALSDSYVAGLLADSGDLRSPAKYSPALIEAKRAQLQLHRLIKSYSWR